MSKAYEIGSDNLVLDGHNNDVKNIHVDVSSLAADGEIKRGQVIDLVDGKYSLHAEGGEVNCIVADTANYLAADENVVVSCYITGSYRKSALVTDVELTATDEESFRKLGIILG